MRSRLHHRACSALLITVFFGAPVAYADKELCVYALPNGEIRQVNSRSSVPEELRSSAKCFAEKEHQNSYLAKPDDVTIKGNLRVQDLSTSLGTMHLRWPRSVERLFGRSPERAVAESASVVSRVLKSGAYPYELRVLDLDWQIVFLDQELPELEVPQYLVDNCHPAWMTPPANMYFIGQRIVAGCGAGRHAHNSTVNDAELSKVVLHEMGHVVEYNLLKGAAGGDRMRAEGFACWFEQRASDSSPVQERGKTRQQYLKLAQESFEHRPDSFTFNGSANDYARASMFFYAIVDKKGMQGLMQIYKNLSQGSTNFLTEVKNVMGWDEARLNKEAKRVLDEMLKEKR